MQYNLIKYRKFNLLTQKDMAILIGVDLRTYANKEHGDSQFKLNEMFIIAKKLNMDISEIFLPTNFMNHEVLEA
ncbi:MULTISPECIES: helix-turn-helix transcriptional regulator [Viridibacillus]|uniref:helix-turn-helix transcriptional regulator n=1 Tax=Viridibacillus TaxID=496496 RepID=UPI0030FA2B0F